MKKIFKRIVIAIVLAAMAVMISTVSIYHYTDNIGNALTVLPQDTQKADCIIVLGAGVFNDQPSYTLSYRLDKAIEIYKMGHTDRIIVSGDHGRKNYDEVNVMRNYLVERGVPIENIFMDHAGFSTYETMYRSRDVFMVESAIIVTQRLHLRRALYIAQNLGLKCVGIEAQDAAVISTRMQNIREYPARVKAFLQCEILHSKPTFLGEQIPVWGNGIATEG